MSNDISAFDSYIESPEHRQIITVLRTILARSTSADSIVVYGDRAAVDALVTTIAYHFPREHTEVGLVAQRGTAIMYGPPFLTPPTVFETKTKSGLKLAPFIHGGQIINAVRQLLHGNPHVLAVTDIDDESKEMLLMEALAGRQIVVGLEADTIDEAVAQMVDNRPVSPEQQIPFHIGIAIEVRIGGEAMRIMRVYRYHEGSLREVVVVNSTGKVVVDSSLLPVSE